MDTKNEHLSDLKVLLLYFGVVLLYVFLGSVLQARELISGLIFSQWGILVLVPAVSLLLFGVNIKNTIKFKTVKFSVFLRVFFIQICIVPLILVLNLIATQILQLFVTPIVPPIPVAEDLSSYGLLLFVIALTPGFCEEFLFRGVLHSTFTTRVSPKKAAILSAVLFGLIHFTPQNLLGPIVLGLVFSYYVEVTGSILPAMFGHFVNNAISVTLSYLLLSSASGELSTVNVEGEINTLPILIFSVVVLVALASIGWVFAKKLLGSLKKTYPRLIERFDEEGNDTSYYTTNYSVYQDDERKMPKLYSLILLFTAALYLVLFVRMYWL